MTSTFDCPNGHQGGIRSERCEDNIRPRCVGRRRRLGYSAKSWFPVRVEGLQRLINGQCLEWMLGYCTWRALPGQGRGRQRKEVCPPRAGGCGTGRAASVIELDLGSELLEHSDSLLTALKKPGGACEAIRRCTANTRLDRDADGPGLLDWSLFEFSSDNGERRDFDPTAGIWLLEGADHAEDELSKDIYHRDGTGGTECDGG
ncbi:hypothetical protein DFH09DRAFT_1077068 [Mycena vulgaris]|nr:hypothetical protein DFH09DRAFT_1077068 [Mycena vulgaris]